MGSSIACLAEKLLYYRSVVVNDGVAPTAATSEPYVPVSRHTAPQSFSSCHEYHSFEEPVLVLEHAF